MEETDALKKKFHLKNIKKSTIYLLGTTDLDPTYTQGRNQQIWIGSTLLTKSSLKTHGSQKNVCTAFLGPTIVTADNRYACWL
jgi:hypothetical protein